MLRARAVWFFTPSNPKLTFGGMEGEPKKEMYDLLPEGFYPSTFNVLPGQDFSGIEQQRTACKISYPLIVKPEVGGQGVLFRKLDDAQQLEQYHKNVTVEYIVQALVNYPVEVCIFYYRYPGHPKGVITGMLQKTLLQVRGNGVNTLEQLILTDPKASKYFNHLKKAHISHLQDIVPAGEKYILSYAANRHRGAQLVNLEKEIDDKLLSLLDGISNRIDDFFYGRYDIMCKDIESLKQGKDFAILEYNGAGAGPTHIYSNDYSITRAYKELCMHWKKLYEVSRINNKRGIPYWPYKKGNAFYKKARAYNKTIKELDKIV